jgi:thiol-disulfide isomerase/thioredoxin
MMNGVSSKLPQFILWSLLPALAIGNALLIRQNLKMRAELNKLLPIVLKSGESVPPFIAQGLNGETFSINYSANEPARVFLFFSPDCSYCHDQFPLWQKIIKHADRKKFSVIGLVADSQNKDRVNQYLRSVDCTELPVALIPEQVRRSYKLSMTPTTLIVYGNGKVRQNWSGKWGGEEMASASDTFGLSFTVQ